MIDEHNNKTDVTYLMVENHFMTITNEDLSEFIQILNQSEALNDQDQVIRNNIPKSPEPILIEVDDTKWQFYGSGIFSDCSSATSKTNYYSSDNQFVQASFFGKSWVNLDIQEQHQEILVVFQICFHTWTSIDLSQNQQFHPISKYQSIQQVRSFQIKQISQQKKNIFPWLLIELVLITFLNYLSSIHQFSKFYILNHCSCIIMDILIDGDSGLMTSQFHFGKVIIDYSHSERIETLVQKSIMQTEIRKRRTGESQSLQNTRICNQMAIYTLNQFKLLISISIQIALELKQQQCIFVNISSNYTCIMREDNQMMFKLNSFCQRSLRMRVLSPTQQFKVTIALFFVKYSKQKLKIDALSGNYKLNEDVLLSVWVKRYNQTHKNFETVDDMSHINPFAITAISMNSFYIYLEDNQEFKQKLSSQAKKQQLQKYKQESSQLALDTFYSFNKKNRNMIINII